MTKILVIEEFGQLCAAHVREISEAATVESVPSLEAAAERHHQVRFDVILWDLGTESESHAEILEGFKRLSDNDSTPQIILVGDSTAGDEIADDRQGCQFLRRPYEPAELKAVMLSALEGAREADQGQATPRPAVPPVEFDGMIAMSMAMRVVFQQIIEASAVDVPVLITGETGTGKDLVASAIHGRSKRKGGPYLAVNMGAIASELIASELFGHEKGAYTGASESRAGFFEQAQHGTLFLDEITTMDEKTQVSLLRVLETKTIRRVRGDRDIKVDVRVIAATNEKIEEAVKARRFREDLYYRLDVFGIHLPPLRERTGGVTLLTEHFVSLFSSQYHKDIRVISPETYRLLRHYEWPGNVRELKNVIQRAVLLTKGAELTPDALPLRIRQSAHSGELTVSEASPIQLGMTLADAERELIRMTIASVAGNKLKAAEILGISRRAIYNKLKRHGLM